MSPVKRVLILALSLASSFAASARDDLGALDLVLSPNNAQPIVVDPGASIHLAVTERLAAARLEAPGRAYPLILGPSSAWRGAVRLRATVPGDVAPGVYSVAVETADRTDVVHRAVYVLEGNVGTYTIAHFANLRVGEEGARDTALYRQTAAIRAGGADLVIVTGDTTAAGTAEEWRVALDILNDCGAPTLVAPGARDLAGGLVDRYLGPYPVARRFGPDGYLVWPAPVLARPDTVVPYLHVARRSIQAARWSIGVTSVGDTPPPMRATLITHVDTPLDAIIQADRVGTETSGSPWGRTRIWTDPGEERGAVTWYRVTLRSEAGLERVEGP